MRFLLTSILSLLICISISAESTYSTDPDIHYSSKNDDYSRKRLSLDVHHDRNVKDMPVIVWFHGGGLTYGNKFVPAEPDGERIRRGGSKLSADTGSRRGAMH